VTPLKNRKKHESIAEKYRLDNIDQLLIRQLAEYPESTIQDLAALIGYSRTGTRKRLDKPAIKKALSEIQKTTDEKLKKVSHTAIKRLTELIASDDEKIALDACKTVLALNSTRSAVSEGTTTARVIYEVQFGRDGRLFSQMSLNDGPSILNGE